MKLDATRIFGTLYQGGWPPPGPALKDAGFQTLVLCAREYQPPHKFPDVLDGSKGFQQPDPFPGVKVIYAPNDDSVLLPLGRQDLSVALQASRAVADSLKAGEKTLVTCWQGRNRSGLVSALALHLHLGCSGRKATAIVKKARRGALTNPMFVAVLSRLRAPA